MTIEKLEEFASNGDKHLTGLDVATGFPRADKPERPWFNKLFGDITKKINELIDVSDEINTIEDMIALYAPTDGTRVTLKGSQGGSFEYNSSKSTLNDGGTVFNGWVRIHFLTHNLVEWFGAKWDGTDTTAELDKAIIESAKTKTVLNFGGSDRTYTINTMRHEVGWQGCSFVPQNNMHLRGDGCKVIVDNRFTSMPDAGHGWAYRVFTTNLLTENISIKGIDFDTQFDKYPDDKHHVGVFVSAGIPINKVHIEYCRFYNGSSANTIGLYLDRFNTVIGRDWKVLNCQLINNGNGADHSPIYLMVDDAEVSVDIIQRFDTVEKNLWAANAIEVHGSNTNIHHCLIDKVGGGIIAGINYSKPIANTLINSNIINTYSGGVTLWSGEDPYDKGHSEVTITGNTIKVLAYAKDGIRKGIGSGGFGSSATVIKISNNTIVCEDATDATTLAIPIDLSYSTTGTSFAATGLVDISNNTTVGGQGIYVRSALLNQTFSDVFVHDNRISINHHLSGVVSLGVNIALPSQASTINNRSVSIRGNGVVTSNPNNTYGYQVSGRIGTLSLKNTVQLGVIKYNVIDAPDTYIDSESIKQPTNLSPYISELSKNKAKFRVNLAGLRVAGAGKAHTLFTLPEGFKVDGVYMVQTTPTTGASGAAISIGDDTVAAAYLKSVTLSASTSGTAYGVDTSQKGSFFTSAPSHYLTTLAPVMLHLSAIELSNISGYIEIAVEFSCI